LGLQDYVVWNCGGWNRYIVWHVLWYEFNAERGWRHSAMNFPIQRILILLSILFLIGCASQPSDPTPAPPTSLPSMATEAQEALIKFFDLLNAKQYAEADILYGGDYEQLIIFSSDVDPSDHARLWSNACELAGLQCLQVRTATFEKLQGDTYIFQVEFSNPDGSLFVLGPCCGANETEMPPVSQFEYKLTRNSNGKFVVMDLPPYVP
jgi:hypothetical protein